MHWWRNGKKTSQETRGIDSETTTFLLATPVQSPNTRELAGCVDYSTRKIEIKKAECPCQGTGE